MFPNSTHQNHSHKEGIERGKKIKTSYIPFSSTCIARNDEETIERGKKRRDWLKEIKTRILPKILNLVHGMTIQFSDRTTRYI